MKAADAFIAATGFVRRHGLLQRPLVARAFLGAYFAYKRLLEDSFLGLTRRHPELFRDGHVLDVGANVGYTALTFARALSDGARVFAFEPDAENLGLLRQAITRDPLGTRVEPVATAVGAAEGSVRLWRNPTHHADHRIATDTFQTPSAGETVAVPLMSLDAFAATRGIAAQIAFVKIDVQGYEPAVCDGMTALLDANPRLAIAFEYTPDSIAELGWRPADLLAFFRDRGFGLQLIEHDGHLSDGADAAIQSAVQARSYVDLLATRPAAWRAAGGAAQ